MSTRSKYWEGVELVIRLEDATYDVKIAGVCLDRCSAMVEGSEGLHATANWVPIKDSQDELVVGMETPLGKAKLVFSPVVNSSHIAGVKIQLELDLAKEAGCIRLIPLCAPVVSADHVVVHGRRMGGCRMLKTPAHTDFESVFQSLITYRDTTLQLTHPLRQKHLSAVSGKFDGHQISHLTVESDVDPCGKSTVASEPVCLFASSNGHDLMAAYGESERTPGNVITHLSSGWNSWDYYRWTISEEEILKNAAFIKRDPILSRHIRRITIDDGWQYCYGEWDANSLFPNGMEYLAHKLTEMGFEAGLWFAPTIFEPHSRLAQVNSEMMATGVSGKPCLAFECMRRYGFILDPTREDSKDWLFELFNRYANMGYQFFKLDFLGQTLKARNFFDPCVPRGEIMRKILEPIRAATLGKARILGCNYHFEAGDDLVDSVRVSGDVHAHWKSIKENSPSIAARFWSQDRLWDNDPDFAVCRGPETSDDPAINSLKPLFVFVTPDKSKEDSLSDDNAFASATLDEAKTLLGLVIISGGCINLSDNLCTLNATGLDLLRKTVSAGRGESGIPLDLFQSEYPSMWTQKTSGGHRILLVNWSDEEKTLSIDLPAQGIEEAIDFWTGEVMATSNGRVVKTLKPHASYLCATRSRQLTILI